MNTITLTHQPGFYERLVLKFLDKMPLGRLTLSLPSGEDILLGNGEGDVKATIRIKDHDFFRRIFLYGDIGFGEAYTDGIWETDNITEVIRWFILNIEHSPGLSGSKTRAAAVNIFRVFNKLFHKKRANNLDGARKNIAEHYDLHNDFFALFLDPSMTYSSALFKEEGMNLQEAQMAKYERLAKQLKLNPSDHVLEIGSGWGGNAIFMARNFGCRVTSVTISEKQLKLARQKVEEAGLTNLINIELQDYRLIQGSFDKIVSIEMLEAVGHEFMEPYFERCHALLKKGGLLALQVITCPDSRYDSLRKGVDWIQKHIFPGTLLPSVGAINKAVNHTGDLSLVDLKDIGLHYAKTLSSWHTSFNNKLDDVRKLGFDEPFIRKWNYYLCYCEAAFLMRNIQVMQMVYSRPNNLDR
ncbi:MAG: class I SAM-dependent methyltransferase [Bacteroidia bacterium]